MIFTDYESLLIIIILVGSSNFPWIIMTIWMANSNGLSDRMGIISSLATLVNYNNHFGMIIRYDEV